MKKLTLVVMLVMSWTAQGLSEPDFICVMKQNTAQIDPCQRGFPGFAYVLSRSNLDNLICTRHQPDIRCKENKKEFIHALGINPKAVCVINFNSPVVGNPCGRASEQYSYVSEPWE
jgi:hypothetical protein